MSFRITARTILQLGAELISSDGIAFYELIKNAFDAGSRRVTIDVYIRIDHNNYLAHLEAVTTSHGRSSAGLEELKNRVVKDLDVTAPQVDHFADGIRSCISFDQLSRLLDEANFIEIRDTGHGMSAADLDEIYLTIGTRHRQKQRAQQSQSLQSSGASASSLTPILGEKGLGRLSAMRLGWRLRVDTTINGEEYWNRLDIDWRDFAEGEALIGEVPIFAKRGKTKENKEVTGTDIRICALNSIWSSDKLQTIAREEFSKLTDPFVPQASYPINIRFNGQPVHIPRFDNMLFDVAHATVEAQYSVDGHNPRLAGHVNYRAEHRETTFALDKRDMLAICEPHGLEILESLGPFAMKLYWYNRRLLTAIEGIGSRQAVQRLVNEWSGGLKVYRDGFRVNPYGSPNDDWIDLDTRALASSGYKVSRRQIIGVVTISSLNNPALIDQTNREGFRETPEKEVLVKLMKHLLEVQFRRFLNEVDRDVKAQLPATFDDLEERVESEERLVRRNLRQLLDKYPEIRADQQLVAPINDAIRRIRTLMDEASRLADSYLEGHAELTNLAGLGLMVEVVAHELNRATEHTLRTIAEADRRLMTDELGSVLETLASQMQTLQKRLRILDPLSTAGRQRKETFDLVAWVRQILASHSAQFSRHNVQVNFKVNPPADRVRVRMVRGMCVQILENLLSNSMYWLKRQRAWERTFKPTINVTINADARTLVLDDNGPGIPLDRRDQVFRPFFTTKPPGEGHGLGLYVSREIAQYNGLQLHLSNDTTVHADRLNTFVLDLEADRR